MSCAARTHLASMDGHSDLATLRRAADTNESQAAGCCRARQKSPIADSPCNGTALRKWP
jgi:hypothetical protein